MDIKLIDPSYAVSGQIELPDLAEITAAGFSTVICNRPDDEVEPDMYAAEFEAEADKLGISFLYNPISKTSLRRQNLELQEQAMSSAKGPVFAYCRSGRRSMICWSLVNAPHKPVDLIIESAANAGYALEALRPQIEAFADGAR